MNKKFTLSFFLLFFLITIHLHSADILKICINTQLGDSVGQVEFTLSGTNATQIDNDANGCYQFEVDDVAGTLNLSLKKDINMNNGLDIADALAMSDFILAVNPISPFQIVALDLNDSGAVTTFDLVLLVRLILGIPNSNISVDSWQFFEPDLDPTTGFPIGASELQLATPISGGIQTINVTGVKTGDVNLNADPSMFASQTADDRSGDLVLKVNDASITTEEVFNVPITFDNFSKLRGLQLTTQFDAEHLEFQEIIIGNLPGQSIESDFYLGNTTEGTINMLWLESTSEGIDLTTEEVLFTVRFKAKSNIILSEVLNINSSSIKAIAYNKDIEPFGITLEFENEITSTETLINQFKLKSNYPNPFQISTQIEYDLPTEEYVRLEVMDGLGRVVEILVDGKQSAGDHQIVFTPNNLSTGMYFSKLIVGKNQFIQKMIYLP